MVTCLHPAEDLSAHSGIDPVIVTLGEMMVYDILDYEGQLEWTRTLCFSVRWSVTSTCRATRIFSLALCPLSLVPVWCTLLCGKFNVCKLATEGTRSTLACSFACADLPTAITVDALAVAMPHRSHLHPIPKLGEGSSANRAQGSAHLQ